MASIGDPSATVAANLTNLVKDFDNAPVVDWPAVCSDISAHRPIDIIGLLPKVENLPEEEENDEEEEEKEEVPPEPEAKKSKPKAKAKPAAKEAKPAPKKVPKSAASSQSSEAAQSSQTPRKKSSRDADGHVN